MQRKPVKKNVYNAGRNCTNQELVHQHMSNHYRRILNAKKTIDTSPPYCYQKKKFRRPSTSTSSVRNIRTVNRNISPALTERSISTNSCKGSCWGTESYTGSSRYHAFCVPENPNLAARGKCDCVDMELVNRITYDTKNGPAAYCDEGWLEIKSQCNDKSCKILNSIGNATDPKRRVQIKSTECVQKRKYVTPIKSTNSPEVPSKRSLGAPTICVCHSNERDLEFKKPPENPKESQISSRDSAYNGGVSSLPESRSPTPDQREKKECLCKENESKPHKIRESSPGVKEAEDFSSSGLESSREVPTKPDTEELKESLKKMKEDELYIKFIQDITAEVLDKGLYTNKALVKVMKKHVIKNLESLDKDRMLKEVDNLRTQLGIPEDKKIVDLDCDSVESTITLNPYPVISDSEFSIPKNLRESIETLPISPNETVTKRNSNKQLFLGCDSDDTENSENSVVHSGKKSREKRKGSGGTATEEIRGNSGDESDQSSECLSINGKKTKNENHSSGNSSENEDLEKKLRAAGERDVKEVFTCMGKKTRSVSFWNNDAINRGVEVKETRTVCCSKRRAAQEEKKNNSRIV